MYGFALCALPERYRLHRFAIVHETGIGLIGAVGGGFKDMAFRKPEGHIFGWH
jgi:hypothetical protein